VRDVLIADVGARSRRETRRDRLPRRRQRRRHVDGAGHALEDRRVPHPRESGVRAASRGPVRLDAEAGRAAPHRVVGETPPPEADGSTRARRQAPRRSPRVARGRDEARHERSRRATDARQLRARVRELPRARAREGAAGARRATTVAREAVHPRGSTLAVELRLRPPVSPEVHDVLLARSRVVPAAHRGSARCGPFTTARRRATRPDAAAAPPISRRGTTSSTTRRRAVGWSAKRSRAQSSTGSSALDRTGAAARSFAAARRYFFSNSARIARLSKSAPSPVPPARPSLPSVETLGIGLPGPGGS